MGVVAHATGMAGEFRAMEMLHRLGHQPALTLGNAKTVDILTESPTGNTYTISVKAIRGGGKWGIGSEDYGIKKNLIFMLFLYDDFHDMSIEPRVWIVPGKDAEIIKKPWHNQFGLYLYKDLKHLLDPFENAWHYLK